MQPFALAPTIRFLRSHLVRPRAAAVTPRGGVPELAPGVALDLISTGVQVNALRLGRAVRIECLAGTAWLTKDGDADDHVLRPGDACTVTHAELAVVAGMPRAEVMFRSVRVPE